MFKIVIPYFLAELVEHATILIVYNYQGLTHKVSKDGESSDAESTKGSCCWDVSV